MCLHASFFVVTYVHTKTNLKYREGKRERKKVAFDAGSNYQQGWKTEIGFHHLGQRRYTQCYNTIPRSEFQNKFGF